MGIEDARHDHLDRHACFGHYAVDRDGSRAARFVGEGIDEGTRVESAVLVADPSAQLAPDTAYEHAHVARVAVVLPEDLGGELMLPRGRLRSSELAQVLKRHSGASGDLSEREVGRLVPIVGDANANAISRRDIEAGQHGAERICG